MRGMTPARRHRLRQACMRGVAPEGCISLWCGAAAGSGGSVVAGALSAEDERYMERYGRLRGILGGTTPITLHLEFLYSHNHADLQAWMGRAMPCCRAYLLMLDSSCILAVAAYVRPKLLRENPAVDGRWHA